MLTFWRGNTALKVNSFSDSFVTRGAAVVAPYYLSVNVIINTCVTCSSTFRTLHHESLVFFPYILSLYLTPFMPHIAHRRCEFPLPLY